MSTMQRIAVLLTCFNRKEKTLQSLEHLFSSADSTERPLDIEVFLTDDGSRDGTSQAVNESYPAVHVLQGTGSLYWAGGMRNSWNAAINAGGFDAYLLLNDDTNVYNILFKEFLETHRYSLNNYDEAGVYVGSTRDMKTKEHSYGGSIFTNRFMARYKKVVPNGRTPQPCELGNANIMLVHRQVVERIGILSDAFTHGLADFDYTLMARKNGIPVLVCPNYLGECERDGKNPYLTYHTLSVKKRIEFLYNPVGLDFRSNLQYMKRNFPYRLPFVFLAAWLKVLFPRMYAALRLTR